MNRGVGGRPIFELVEDFIRFLALLACAVRSGTLIVRAYALLPTHFHVLAVSVTGETSETLRRIQCLYASAFNLSRSEPRTGHLFGGRFRSIPVETEAYHFTVLRYIDFNPVKAGLARSPIDYPYGSARYLAGAEPRPKWLSPESADRFLSLSPAPDGPRERRYRETFHAQDLSDEAVQLVRMRLGGRSSSRQGPDALDSVLGFSAPDRVRWLEERSLRGDGTRVSAPLAAVSSIRGELGRRRLIAPCVGRGRGRGGGADPWDALEVGLLRDLGGQSFPEVGRALRISGSHAGRRYATHKRLMQEDRAYGLVAADLARGALLRCHGSLAGHMAQEAIRRRLSREGGVSA